MALLDVEEVRTYMRGVAAFGAGDLGSDELVQTYVDAVTPVIEDLVGPVEAGTRTITLPGDRASLVLPWAFSAVVSIVEDGVTLGSAGYRADGQVGIVHRTVRSAGTVTVTVAVGDTTPPGNVKLAALELFRHLWASRQGNRPAFGGRTNDDTAYQQTVYVPSGFAVPHKVAELLAPSRRMPGFA